MTGNFKVGSEVNTTAQGAWDKVKSIADSDCPNSETFEIGRVLFQ